jgi:hypothetical protein
MYMRPHCNSAKDHEWMSKRESETSRTTKVHDEVWSSSPQAIIDQGDHERSK